MVHAQKIVEGIYLSQIDSESTSFELIHFNNDRTFTNFHGKKSGNELGKGLITIESNVLTMEFEDMEIAPVFDKIDTIPVLGSKVMPYIVFFDKKLGTGVVDVKIYVNGKEDKPIISDYTGIATLPPDMKVGSILIIKAKGFYTQELVYDGFFRISYHLTNDSCYKTSDGPRQYSIVNISPDSIELSFSFDSGLHSSNIESHTMIYKKITEEKAKELLGYQPEYIKFMLK